MRKNLKDHRKRKKKNLLPLIFPFLQLQLQISNFNLALLLSRTAEFYESQTNFQRYSCAMAAIAELKVMARLFPPPFISLAITRVSPSRLLRKLLSITSLYTDFVFTQCRQETVRESATCELRRHSCLCFSQFNFLSTRSFRSKTLLLRSTALNVTFAHPSFLLCVFLSFLFIFFASLFHSFHDLKLQCPWDRGRHTMEEKKCQNRMMQASWLSNAEFLTILFFIIFSVRVDASRRVL